MSEEKITTNLGFAVWPIDDFTGGPPFGRVRIWLEEIGLEGFANASGYYLFLDIDDKLPDIGTVTASSYEGYYKIK